MSNLSEEELAWAHRMRAFLQSGRITDDITEDDFDRLAEHWKLRVRLHNIDLSEYEHSA